MSFGNMDKGILKMVSEELEILQHAATYIGLEEISTTLRNSARV